jgi:hypothetical protein
VPYPKELFRHLAIAVGSCLLLALIGFYALVYGYQVRTSEPVFLVLGVSMACLAIWWVWLLISWYQTAARLVREVSPLDATISLQVDSDTESTCLRVQTVLSGRLQPEQHRVAILTPSWDYQSLLGAAHPAAMFIDPKSHRVMAISTDLGVPWCIPHNECIESQSK